MTGVLIKREKIQTHIGRMARVHRGRDWSNAAGSPQTQERKSHSSLESPERAWPANTFGLLASRTLRKINLCG